MNRAPRKLRWDLWAPLVVFALAALPAFFGREHPGTIVPERAWQSPSWAHWLGCGEGGIDLLPLVSAALLRGVVLAICVALTGFAIGTPLGAFAALRRGVLERVVLRAADLLQAFPSFLLALCLLSAVRSPSRLHLYVVFSLTAWAPYARFAIAETRILRSAAFVEAGRVMGLTTPSIVWRHILPNLLPIAAVQLGASAAATLVSEAALSFVGLGPTGGVTLGSVLDQGVVSMLRSPHVLIVGALAIALPAHTLLRVSLGLSKARR